MRLIAPLPLGVLRRLGTVLGRLLYMVARRRRHVVLTNLALCFPQESPAQRKRWARAVFVHFAQSFLDRAWLWHGDPQVVRRRLRMTGALHELETSTRQRTPLVVFAPHFFGIDAAATALTMRYDRNWCDIYVPQRNPAIDRWVQEGRKRFGRVELFVRKDGVKPIVSMVRQGGAFFLAPDMSLKRRGSIFVPFYGVPTATVPSLPRFAQLCRAQVLPATARITPDGYDVEVHPVWQDYPSGDDEADTVYMNRWLEGIINTMPDQYYWVHRRFKRRPRGEKKFY